MDQPARVELHGELTYAWLVYYGATQFFLIWATGAEAARRHVEHFGYPVVKVLPVLGAGTRAAPAAPGGPIRT